MINADDIFIRVRADEFSAESRKDSCREQVVSVLLILDGRRRPAARIPSSLHRETWGRCNINASVTAVVGTG